MARRSNPLINHALLTDILARQREEQYHSHDEEYIAPEDRFGLYPVFPASELGLLRTVVNPSATEVRRERAADGLMFRSDRLDEMDGFFNDLDEHLRELGKTISVYLRSPLLVVLSVLMVAGHAGVLIGGWEVTNSGSGFGSAFFNNLIMGWTIYNVVVFTLVAFSPLLCTSLYTSAWWLTGGKKHKLLRVLIPIAVVPAFFLGYMVIFNGNGVNPVVPAIFAAHAVLPFVIRSIAMQRIKAQVRKLRRELKVGNDAVGSTENAAYLESLLRRSVIGTPGASLGTSGFSADQVAAGVAGERKTAAVLDEFARNNTNAVVFHSVRWNMDGAPYDIDHVVVVGSTVFFLDSKNWSKGDYKMLASGDTVLRNGQPIPNGAIHVQSGADTYINAFGVVRHFTQVVVWSDGTLSNEATYGPRLVTATEMLDWLNRTAHDQNVEADGYDVPLLRRLEANTAS